MRVLSLANAKGGVGKSTMTVSIASVLADTGRVLVIDTDPQQSVTWWAGQVGQDALPFDFDTSFDPAAITRLRTLDSYDTVIIDTPGTLEAEDVATAVLSVADYVILPTDPAPLAMVPLLHTISNRVMPLGIPFRVLINRVDPRAAQAEVADIQALLEERNIPYFKTFVRSYKAHERAAMNKQVASTYGGDRSARNATEDIRRVVQQLLSDWSREQVRS